MIEPTSDPWESLADELGVEAPKGTSPLPAAPPPSSSPLRAADRPSHSPPPAKKPPADWHALAGALGLEIPPESEPPVQRKDPVAELFGFPSPPPRTRAQEEEERHQRSEQRAVYQDEEDERAVREAASDRDESEERYERPPRERSDEADFEAGDRFESRGPTGDEGYRERGPRRRRRGGRGRGRGNDRGSRPGDSRRTYRPEAGGEAPPEREFGAEREEFESLVERPDRPDEGEGARTRYEDESRRRRRGRRGGQRRRPARAEGAVSETRPQEMPSETSAEDELEIEFESLGQPGEEESAIDVTVEPAAVSESEQLDSESGEESHELHGGKGSVRDILTWKEAIGIMIDSNLQTRSRAPHASHPQRGSRRGRGRHRGG